MNMIINDGKLVLNLEELFEQLTLEQKIELAEHLAIDEAVIDFVAQQIVNQYTENMYSGLRCCHAYPIPGSALDKAARQIALAANDITSKQMADIIEEWKAEHLMLEAYRNHAHYLQHLLDDPNIPPPPYEYEVRKRTARYAVVPVAASH